MKEVFEYYLEICHQAWVFESKLAFEFGNYHIVFSFTNSTPKDNFENQNYSYRFIDNIFVLRKFLEEGIQFTSLNLIGYEYLGHRENLEDVLSITNQMYALIKKLNAYKSNSVHKYYTDIDYGDPMCSNEGNYQFIIEINTDYWWDKKFAKYIHSVLIPNDTTVPDFYTVFFRINKEIKDEKSLPILSTNTKVRRLGYFKILSIFFRENKKVPVSYTNKKFENYCLAYKDILDSYQFKKGLIKETKTGISAKPYIEVANDLGLLNKINNLYYESKLFKVYQILQGRFSAAPNIFQLTDFDKAFFLEAILKNDYFYFSNLLVLIFMYEKITYSRLIETYQNRLINSLEDYKQANSYGDRKLLMSLETISNRIKKWEKADIYLEHILMPRLNWMLDLGIIKGTNAEYTITNIGLKLFRHLAIWDDINKDKIISPISFLNRFMIHLFDDCFKNNASRNPDKNVVQEKIYTYIEESFSLFKTLAPNRVTASQAANYTKYKLYFVDHIKVGYLYVLEQLSEEKQDKFIFKFQEQYQDGYIQKKN